MTYIKFLIEKINFETIKNLNYKEYKKRVDNENYPNYEDGNELTFTQFNLFIGTNGGGKSTILDILLSLKTNNFKNLKRENISGHSISRFSINDGEFEAFLGENSFRLVNNGLIDIRSNYDGTGKTIRIAGKDVKEELSDSSFKTDFNLKLIENYKGEELLSSTVYDCIEKIPEIFDSSIFLGLHYSGEGSVKCFENDKKAYDEDLVKLFLKTERILQDDGTPCHGNIIKINELPSGWKQAIWVLSNLDATPNGSIVLLEEPEIHLNAQNQRYLIEGVIKICIEKDLQLFMTTHSSSFIDLSIRKNFSLFNCNGKTIYRENIFTKLLDNLGVRGSDILQTNCIIWVEGPSDRIYIKNWLDLYSLKQKKQFIENIDYSFQFYGGSNLFHFNGDKNEDLKDSISMFKINKNSIIVMDSDLDFLWYNQKNNILDEKKGKTKQRIKDECMKDGGHVWITQYYTIENYLPDSWKQKNLYINNFNKPYCKEAYFENIHNNRILLDKKVYKSTKFFREGIDKFSDSYDLETNLKDEIKKIYDLIIKYNR